MLTNVRTESAVSTCRSHPMREGADGDRGGREEEDRIMPLGLAPSFLPFFLPSSLLPLFLPAPCSPIKDPTSILAHLTHLREGLLTGITDSPTDFPNAALFVLLSLSSIIICHGPLNRCTRSRTLETNFTVEEIGMFERNPKFAINIAASS